MLNNILDLSLYLLLFPLCLLLFVYGLFSGSPFVSASRQHYLLVNAVLASFLVIVLPFFAPKLFTLVLPFWVAEYVPNHWFDNHWYWVAGIYFLGLSWCLFYLLFGLWAIKRLTDEATPIATADIASYFSALQDSERKLPLQKIRFMQSHRLNSPLTWGWLRPVILLPQNYRQWPRDRVLRVLLHEIAHIQRSDWLSKLAVHGLCALMWYLLPVWLFAKKIHWFAELACDDAVINRLGCRAEYAQDLLDIARNNHGYFAMALQQEGQLYRRIHSVLDGCRNRDGWGRGGRKIIAAVFFPVVCLASTLHASVAQHAPYGYRASKLYPLLVVPLPGRESPASSERKHDERAPQAAPQQQNKPVVKPTSRDSRPGYAAAIIPPGDIAWPGRDSEELVVIAQKSAALGGRALGAESSPQVTFKGYLPVKMVTPKYPRQALIKGIEGKVIVQFDVSAAGLVDNMRIVYAQPDRVFNKSVMRALAQFKFMPLTFGGEAIKTKNVSETFIFSLKDPATDNKPPIQFNGRSDIATRGAH